MNKPISLCYHPTSIILIDDNDDFLQSIKLVLEKSLICKAYSDPLQARDFFKNYQTPSFIQHCFVKDTEDKLDHLSFNIDLRKIHQELCNNERFQKVAVAVIDYNMPGIDGLSLSRQIKTINPYYQIILLTGDADQDLAINAFNEGIIDHFIKKDAMDLSIKLLAAIKAMEKQYFNLLSQSVLDRHTASPSLFRMLNDPKVCQFFQTLCLEKNIIEYYLLDAYGNYLLIDEYGKLHWLALLSDSEVQEFLDFAIVEAGTPSVISALKNREKIPFFYTEEDLMSPPSKWDNYLYPATRIEGEQAYFYALIPTKTDYEKALGNFISYHAYLDQLI